VVGKLLSKGCGLETTAQALNENEGLEGRADKDSLSKIVFERRHFATGRPIRSNCGWVDIDNGRGSQGKLYAVQQGQLSNVTTEKTFWKTVGVSSKSMVAKKWLSRSGAGTVVQLLATAAKEGKNSLWVAGSTGRFQRGVAWRALTCTVHISYACPWQ
jgi:hypothetical protein